MKALLTLALLLSTPAFAEVKVATDCGSYGPNADNLAVSTDYDFIDVGYITMDVFFPLKTTGCKTITYSKDILRCDGVRIGTLGEFKSTNDNGGEPRAHLKLDPHVEAALTGSCSKKNDQLQLSISK